MLLHAIAIPRARRDPPARAGIRPFSRPAPPALLHPVHAVTKRSITRTIASAAITLPARRRDHRDGIPVSPHELHPAGENGDDLDGSQKVRVWRGSGSEGGFPCATVSKRGSARAFPLFTRANGAGLMCRMTARWSSVRLGTSSSPISLRPTTRSAGKDYQPDVRCILNTHVGSGRRPVTVRAGRPVLDFPRQPLARAGFPRYDHHR